MEILILIAAFIIILPMPFVLVYVIDKYYKLPVLYLAYSGGFFYFLASIINAFKYDMLVLFTITTLLSVSSFAIFAIKSCLVIHDSFLPDVEQKI